jgi:hypothetical protein
MSLASRTACALAAALALPGGTRILFLAIRQTVEAPEERAARDPALELELVRRLEPAAADRIEGAAAAAGR